MRIREFSGEEFEHVACEMFVPVIARTRPEFRGRVALQELGEAVTLCRAHWGGPMRTARTTRMTARTSTGDFMHFSLHLSGEADVHHRNRFAQFAPGWGVLIESRSPWERIASTETRVLNLQFHRKMLPLCSTEITEACARNLEPAAPAMQMLSAYLGQLFEVADSLTAGQRLDAGRSAIDLLAMALRDVTPSVPGADGSASVVLEMMRTHVRKHLADPDLRVEELARRHHMSVGHAYTLFERIGTTPGAYLREQRLLAARTMLSNPRYDRLTISSIAATVGFRDLSTFGRAFRRQYGTTPAGWRREHRHP